MKILPIRSILAIICASVLLNTNAQSPEAFNYQAVVRDASGQPLVNQSIALRMGIAEKTPTGTLAYQEKHNVTTTANGTVSIQAGGGAVLLGSFGNINWGEDAHFLIVDLDPNGGSSYSNIGIQQLISVPYALHATTTDLKTGSELDGTGMSSDPLLLDQQGAVTGEVLKWNGSSWVPKPDDQTNAVWSRTGSTAFYNSGNVGIGTSSPMATLHVNSTLQLGSFEQISDAGGGVIGVNSVLAPDNDGLIPLGISSKRWNTVFAANGMINTSDRRDKKNIDSLDYGLLEIMQLEPVRFEWKDRPEGGQKIGLIAQNLQQVLPEVVVDTEWVVNEETGERTEQEAERLGVYYSDIIPVLIKGMQEQQAIIEELQLTIQKLEAKMESGKD